MTKEDFNNLSIEEQVLYINSNLKNKSLTKICKEMNMNRPTISKRFNSKGYIFKDNQYILNNTDTTINTSDSKVSNDNKDIYRLRVEMKLLERRIDELEKYINTDTTINTDINDIKIFEGNEVVRSFRINEDIQKRFKAFCKAHSEYRVSDLINNALDEYMNKK